MPVLSLPKNLDAEKALIGLVLKDNSLYWQAVKHLKPLDFYIENNQRVWAALQLLSDESKPFDVVLIQKKIKESGYSIEIKELNSYTENLPVNPNFDEYVNLIKEKSISRQKARLHAESQSAILADDLEKYNRVQEELETLEQYTKKEEPAKISTHGEAVLQKAFDRGESGLILTGIKTGFKKLDALTSGLQPESLTIIAARPRVGKTSFCLNVAKNITLFNKEAVVLFFSLEMSWMSLMIRLLAAEARINSMRVKNGLMTLEEWARLIGAYDRLSEGNLIIEDTFNIGINNVRATAKNTLKEHKRLDLIIIDYIQLMNTERAATKNDEVAKLSRGLKFLAKEFKIPVIALSQLSRASERRENNHRPQLSDLRDSGAIEQDADIVAFLHREELYNKTEDNQGLAKLIIAKHRDGDQDLIDLHFIKEYTRFENLTLNKH